jgi:hypothetical protein
MYSSEISRKNPALITFLLDCSYSMSEAYGTTGASKGQFLARITNKCIDNIILSCEKGDELRGYFEIGIIGYSDNDEIILPVKSIIDLANNPKKMIKVKDKKDGVDMEYEQPVWLEDPTRKANTNMIEGFETAKSVISKWTGDHKGSFPPVLIHVSDGQWTTESPVEFVQNMPLDVYTDDGPAIIMNIHISNDPGDPIAFPNIEPDGNEYLKGLFKMSTELPATFLKRAQEEYAAVVSGARGYMFNANPEDLSKFFDIGTRLIG